MTKEEKCRQCPQHDNDLCGLVSRNLQRKCNSLSDWSDGYDDGVKDATEKAVEWLKCNIFDYVWTDGHGIVHYKNWENDFRTALEE